MKEKNKVLLFGSKGFIASNFIKKNINHKIISLDRANLFKIKKKNYNFKKIDLSLKSLDTSKYKFNYQFDCAILTSYNINFKNSSRKKFISENTRIIKNSLKICKINNIKKLIYISSAAVYGIKKNKIKENFSLKPLNIYGVSKVITEKLITDFSKINKVDYCIFRIFNAYGFHPNNIICRFLEMKNKNIPIKINGKGNQVRDFIFIDDIIEAFNIVINHNKVIKKTLNLCSGKPIQMSQIIKKISSNFIHSDPIFEPNSILGSTNLIKKTLNWTPRINFDQGLSKLKSYF